MSEIVLLDSAPLGMLSNPKSTPENEECRAWLAGMLPLRIALPNPLARLSARRAGERAWPRVEAGFAEPWVRQEKTRAREAGESRFRVGVGSVSVARFAGLLLQSVFPGFRKKRSTLGHTLPPAKRAEKCPNSRAATSRRSPNYRPAAATFSCSSSASLRRNPQR